MRPLLITGLIALISLTGCVSRHTEVEKYSGFLANYNNLHQATSASGAPVLRWVSPDFDGSKYDKLVLEPVLFWPGLQPVSRPEPKNMDRILAYLNQKLASEAEKKLPLVQQADARTLIVRSAVTAVENRQQGLKFYEVMPVSILIAGTQMVTGFRTLDTTFYFEGEVIDANTMQPVIKVVRKDNGETLANSRQPLTVQQLKTAIDNLVADITAFKLNHG